MFRRAVLALLVVSLARGDTPPATATGTTTTTTVTTTSITPAPNIADLASRTLAGDPVAAVDLSVAYFSGNGVAKDDRKAFDLSLEGAIQGDIGGIRNLGYAYRTGLGVHANLDKSYDWYLKGAQQGDAQSEMNVAIYNQYGAGRVANTYAARSWMEKAAIQGLPEAEGRYGDMLMYGIGGDTDQKLGFAYYLRSANGCPPVRYIIAKCYANGLFVPRDLVRAYAWCLTAKGTNPDPKVADLPQKLEASLTVDQLAQATALAPSLLSFVFSGPTQPPNFTATLTPGPSTTLKYQKVFGFMVVTLNFQDKEPLDFIVDTGCPTSVLDSRLATRLGLVGGDPFPWGGTGPKIGLMSAANSITLSAPGVRFANTCMVLMPDFNFDRFVGRPLAGFIGSDLLRHFVVHIDYIAHTITLTQPGQDKPDPHATELPMKLMSNLIFTSATVSSGTTTGGPADLLIDTGDIGALTVGPNYLAKYPSLSIPAQVPSGAVGFGGNRYERDGLATVALGSQVVSDLRTAVVKDRLGNTAGGPTSFGGIGQYVWSRFDLTLDYPAGKIRLAPNAKFGAPHDFSEDGAGLWTAADDYHRFLVYEVVPDSPAAFFGLKAGDEVTSIDGKAVQGLTFEQVEDLRRKAGPHEFKIHRNGADLSIHSITYDPFLHPDQIPLYKTNLEEDPPGAKIASLAVEWMRPALYPDAVILRTAGLKVGDVYLAGTANRALKRLYATGLFANAGLHADNTPDGLRVSILVDVRPLVKTVTFNGLTGLEEMTLRPQLIAEEGQRLSPTDLFHDAATIKRVLGENSPSDRTVTIHVAFDDNTTQQRDVMIPKAKP